jgi:hypothetical protein
MQTPSALAGDTGRTGVTVFGGKSAASWPSIIAGAFVAVGATFILAALGSGLGFAAVSPWPGAGVSAATFSAMTAIWLIVTQWISAGLGGYIAGRLRTRWIGTHTHEVFFRDTAHGLVTWAVATVVVATFAGASLVSVVGHSTEAAADAAIAGSRSPGDAYLTDKLFRSADPSDMAHRADVRYARAEADHIMANALLTGAVSEGDRSYLAALLTAATHISPAEAQQRVDGWIADSADAASKAKATADAARKQAAEAAIFLSLALLMGAFIASVSAALGGHLRDEHP